MNRESRCTGVLCQDFRLYVVPGLRISSGKCQTINGICVSQKDKWSHNQIKSWFGLDNDERFRLVADVDGIRAAMKEASQCNCQKIKRVFVSHSYGSQRFYEALTDWKILPMQGARAFDQSALIAVGGTAPLPKDTAKVS